MFFKSTLLRFLGQRKLYTAISLFGLAVSLMFVILIGDYCIRTLDVDRSYSRSDDIYVLNLGERGFVTNYVTAMDLADQLPDIEQKCAVAGSERTKGYHGSKDNEAEFTFLLADSNLFDFFEYRFLYGDSSEALSSKDKAVITESLALKLFDRKDVIGEEIIIKDKEEFPLIVSGVIKNLRQTVLDNSAELITHIENSSRLGKYYHLDKQLIFFGETGAKTFYMLTPGTELDDDLPFIKDYFTENDMGFRYMTNEKTLNIAPLKGLMFHPANINSGLESANKTVLWILLAAGFAILLFALTNYINLTVAQTGDRAKEMACRRLLGESGGSVAARLVLEALIMTTLAFGLGFVLALLFEDKASALTLSKIDIIESLSPRIVLFYVLIIALTALLSGILPAWTISRYKPIDIVKGSFRYDSKMLFSKVFIFLQYAATVAMLVCAGTIYLQIQHLMKAPLGHEIDNIVELTTQSISESKYEALRDELSALSFVEAVSQSQGASFFSRSRMLMGYSDEDGSTHMVNLVLMEKELIDLLGLEVLSDMDAGTDAQYLNESAARLIGVKDGDTEFTMGQDTYPLAGVIRDFKMASVLEDTNPVLIMQIKSGESSSSADDNKLASHIVYIKVKGEKQEVLNGIKSVSLEVLGDSKYQCSYAEDILATYFEDDKVILKLISAFTIIALLISSLGLFAISIHFTRGKSKEIALRKIFGGANANVLRGQLLQMIAPILASFVAAVPLAYFVMERWLSGYSYRMAQPAWLYALAAAFVIVLGILSVLAETVKVVNRNPVDSIKTE